ncbi:SDR family oxidoreductase [Thiocapsa roseopersicina]|uniref:NAD(P)-dependent dehydrogenase, short-chain alcohol dehydrogenase family n=1 Tax=Thiocapsa roseopersicina TaxID=1058 RepID=A0A1H2RIU2_THIRO|nr:SDR family oxidoreductase [Thiocapsa roseopersicina]SDW19090.1 NAD(P)-dependent dehydrogenase, short-chain alcohol dehydrogenase family [Thiocapsa roseopersicina]
MTDTNRKTVLVTGANSGLGKAIALAFARDGMRVGMLVRNEARGLAARDEILAATGNREISLFVADLGSQHEVRRAAAEILDRFERLDLLINNAGTAYASRRTSPEGLERSLAVNHLGPFLLTGLLLERIKASAPARIVNVGTKMDTAMDFDDLDWTRRRYRMMQAYGQSKLGNLHFTFELARRLAGTGVSVNCVFPGVFRSNLGGSDGAQGIFWKAVDLLLGWALPTPTRAAERVLHAARSPDLDGVTGRYLGDRRSIKAPSQALDADANRRLWTISERLVGFSQNPAARFPGS